MAYQEDNQFIVPSKPSFQKQLERYFTQNQITQILIKKIHSQFKLSFNSYFTKDKLNIFPKTIIKHKINQQNNKLHLNLSKRNLIAKLNTKIKSKTFTYMDFFSIGFQTNNKIFQIFSSIHIKNKIKSNNLNSIFFIKYGPNQDRFQLGFKQTIRNNIDNYLMDCHLMLTHSENKNILQLNTLFQFTKKFKNKDILIPSIQIKNINIYPQFFFSKIYSGFNYRHSNFRLSATLGWDFISEKKIMEMGILIPAGKNNINLKINNEQIGMAVKYKDKLITISPCMVLNFCNNDWKWGIKLSFNRL